MCPARPTSAKPPAAPLRKKVHFGPPFPRVRSSRLFHVSFCALLGPHRPKRPPRRSKKVHFGPRQNSRQNSRGSDFSRPFPCLLLCPLVAERRRAAQTKVHFGLPPVPPNFPRVRSSRLFYVSFCALLGHIGQTARRAGQKKSPLWAPGPRQNFPRTRFPRLAVSHFMPYWALIGQTGYEAHVGIRHEPLRR